MSEPGEGPGEGPGEVDYPRLLRTATWAPWRPLLGVVLALAWFFVAGTVLVWLLYLFLVVQSAIDGEPRQPLAQAITLERLTPASLLYLNVVLATLTLLAFALVRVVHGVRPRWLTSVRPGLRWRFFLGCLPLAVVAMVVQVVLGLLVPTDGGGGSTAQPDGVAGHLGGQALAFALVIVLSTPLQALGEEYVFRGYVMQAVGSWFGHWRSGAAVTTVVLSAALFAAAHGSQSVPLFVDRFGFGVLAAVLVLLVGGLEAGIALHVMNNFFAFGAALLSGTIATVLTSAQASWWNVPVTVVQSLLYLAMVLALARRLGVARRGRGPDVDPDESTGSSIGAGPR